MAKQSGTIAGQIENLKGRKYISKGLVGFLRALLAYNQGDPNIPAIVVLLQKWADAEDSNDGRPARLYASFLEEISHRNYEMGSIEGVTVRNSLESIVNEDLGEMGAAICRKICAETALTRPTLNSSDGNVEAWLEAQGELERQVATDLSDLLSQLAGTENFLGTYDSPL